MSPRLRAVLLGLAFGVLAPLWWLVARAMPLFGQHASPYGDAVNAIGTATRHVTNMVSMVNFDLRGIDTLGEESMLMCAVAGAVMLLRGGRGEGMDDPPAELQGRFIRVRSDAVVLTARLAGPVCILFGVYVSLHAMTTPGGGFQGGVIVATGMLMAFLGDGYGAWRRVARSPLLNAAEGAGVALYGLCGVAGLLAGLPFLTNTLPFGQVKDVFSGGLMQIENIGTTLAVTGGFCLLFVEFLEETRAAPPEADARGRMAGENMMAAGGSGARDDGAVAGGVLPVRDRALRDGDQPARGASDRQPVGGAERHLCAAAGDRVPDPCRAADLL